MTDWIYKITRDNSARFLLGVECDDPLICIGINCSTAGPEKLDNTVRRVPSFAEAHGHDGWLMLNVYPQRATDPKQMHKEYDRALHRKNVAAWKEVSQKWHSPRVWCAWGRLIRSRPWLPELLGDLVTALEPASPRWVHFGDLTKDGDPRHPLYLRKDSQPQPFDPHSYLKECF